MLKLGVPDVCVGLGIILDPCPGVDWEVWVAEVSACKLRMSGSIKFGTLGVHVMDLCEVIGITDPCVLGS